ncbi:MAG: glycosyltransferase [Magnetococcus sp. YQC-3]
MQQFLETVFHLDAQNDIVGLQKFILSKPYGVEHVWVALQKLLAMGRVRSAYLLALMLDKAGHNHFFISLALAAGGFDAGNAADEARGLRMLTAHADAMTFEQRETIFSKENYLGQNYISPLMVNMLNSVLPKPGSAPLVMRVLDILKAAVPLFRDKFDWDAPVPVYDWEKARQQGREDARILVNPVPPKDAPRVPRRAVVVWPKGHRGWGLRAATTLSRYGWQAEQYDRLLELSSATEFCRDLLALCQQKKVEVVMFELFGAGTQYLLDRVPILQELIVQLRQQNPAIKVGGIMVDVHGGREQLIMEKMADSFDVLWSYLPYPIPHYENPTWEKKVLRAWIPYCDGNMGTPDRPLLPQLLFDATIHAGSWSRVFWVAATDRLGLPITKHVNQFSYDSASYKSSPLGDYEAYMRRLGDATCCLLYSDFSVHGRTMEVPLMGSLLVQEEAIGMRGFFIPGEHFLEFSSIAELAGLVRFITEHREEAEEIRRAGNAYARERYNDHRLVAELDYALFFAD